ncbi:MAG: hypothetical protein ACXACD_11870 [Candidatus Thorarchaeota archaeon]
MTANFALMLKSRSDKEFGPIFMKASEPIAKIISLGLILVTLSGVGFYAIGYPETQLLLIKHVLVVALWINGFIMMFYLQPKLKGLAPRPDKPPTPEFFLVQKQMQTLGIIGIVLWYAITVQGVLL